MHRGYSLSLVALPIELDLHCLDYSIKNNRCSSYLTQKILCAPRSLLYYLMKQYILFLLQSRGGCRVRTCDPLLVRQVLSQLSESSKKMVARAGLEPVIPP